MQRPEFLDQPLETFTDRQLLVKLAFHYGVLNDEHDNAVAWRQAADRRFDLIERKIGRWALATTALGLVGTIVTHLLSTLNLL